MYKFAKALSLSLLALFATPLFIAKSVVAQPDINFSIQQGTPPFPRVKFYTSLGEFTVELFPKEAPNTVENFLQYVDEGFYVGTIFHRVVPEFVAQGGGLDFNFTEKKTRASIATEANNGLKNYQGTLAMARTSDPNSADAQFFVNLADNDDLDFVEGENAGYTVFGRVSEGNEVFTKIANEPRGIYRSRPNAPNYPVIIEAVERLPTLN